MSDKPETGHIGAWGTPDYGLTEWLSRLLGNQGLTSQGGSNLTGATTDTNLIKTDESGGYIPTGSAWQEQRETTLPSDPTQTTTTSSPSGGSTLSNAVPDQGSD